MKFIYIYILLHIMIQEIESCIKWKIRESLFILPDSHLHILDIRTMRILNTKTM